MCELSIFVIMLFLYTQPAYKFRITNYKISNARSRSKPFHNNVHCTNLMRKFTTVEGVLITPSSGALPSLLRVHSRYLARQLIGHR